MNIQTNLGTKKLGAGKDKKVKPQEGAENKEVKKETSAPEESFTPAAKDDNNDSRFKAGIRGGVALGSKLEKPLGGAAALGLAALSGAALSFGGAVVGGIVGGGFGPVISSITSDGVMNFLGNSFSNMGTAIQIGSTIGAVTGLAGGLVIGANAGGTVAKTAAFVPGFLHGVASPSSYPKKDQKADDGDKHRSELRGVFRSGAKVASGVGVLSGAVGGFVGGAAVTAAGSLVADVAGGGFTWDSFVSQLGTKALIGGAVGGVTLAAVGGYGGEGIARASQWGYDKTLGRLTAGKPGLKERIAKKEVELEDRQIDLEAKTEELASNTANYRSQHADTSKHLDGREDQMKSDETRVAKDLAEVEGRIETNATADYEKRAATPDGALDAKGNHGIIGERSSLKEWDKKLTGWQGDLNTFRGELQSWEKKLDNEIDVKAGGIFAEERKPHDKHFNGLMKELDAFETRLNEYEADINRRIQEAYRSGIASQKPGVESDLRAARDDESRSSSEKSSARSTRDAAHSRHSSAESALSSARGRLSRARSEGSSLDSRISRLRSQISSLDSQLRSCRSSL